MFEEIWKWLIKEYPAVLIVGAFIVITYKSTRFFMAWYHRFKIAESECKKIEDKLVPKLDGVQNSINAVLIYLKNKDKSMDTSLFQSKSPFQLTPVGSKILNDCGGKQFVDSNINYLIEQINKEEIKSALDVENISATVILYSSNLDSFTKIKDFIYNNPIYKIGDNDEVQLDLSTMINIISIYLRDCYLLRYPHLLHTAGFIHAEKESEAHNA